MSRTVKVEDKTLFIENNFVVKPAKPMGSTDRNVAHKSSKEAITYALEQLTKDGSIATLSWALVNGYHVQPEGFFMRIGDEVLYTMYRYGETKGSHIHNLELEDKVYSKVRKQYANDPLMITVRNHMRIDMTMYNLEQAASIFNAELFKDQTVNYFDFL
ncbi:hypothetical protein [Vibrio barjaei]|uniref:hypothetical protein n=1 Tax=Vibrio barjaei TaxID=1676683 RepID=UPI0022842100|nr:hypothetical protein [Vibrio barjaei]MCY9870499.1 hypothetical protein [Vibrio barjaei]